MASTRYALARPIALLAKQHGPNDWAAPLGDKRG
jgi:hypothetical protein